MKRLPSKFWILSVFLTSFVGCASHRTTISGNFGEIVSPNQDQVAIIWNMSGDSTIAGKIQEDNDTLFLQTLDFDILPIPKDSISRIEIRNKSNMEKTGMENAAVNQLAKDAATETGIRSAVWIAVAVPFIILGLVVNGYLDSLSK